MCRALNFFFFFNLLLIHFVKTMSFFMSGNKIICMQQDQMSRGCGAKGSCHFKPRPVFHLSQTSQLLQAQTFRACLFILEVFKVPEIKFVIDLTFIFFTIVGGDENTCTLLFYSIMFVSCFQRTSISKNMFLS